MNQNEVAGGLYKLLIVDDEPLVREGLSLSIAWSSYGFSPVGEAANGEEALEKIKLYHPDAVITDMRMDVMDGVSLIQRLKSDYPEIQIVILTAYNEFFYAKTAIDSNVFAYITKPASKSDIISVFCRLREKMEKEQQLKSKLKSYDTHRVDKLLSRLLLCPELHKEDIEELKQYLTNIAEDEEFIVAVMEPEVEVKKDSLAAISRYETLLDEQLNCLVGMDDFCAYKAYLSPKNTALLIFLQSGTPDSSFPLLSSIQDGFTEASQCALTIGVSTKFRQLISLPQAYDEARKALDKKVQLGLGRIIFFSDIQAFPPQTPLLSTHQMQEITDGLMNHKEQEVFQIIKQHFSLLESCDIDPAVVKHNMAALTMHVVRGVFQSFHTLQLVFGREVHPKADTQALQTVEQIRLYLMDFFANTLLYIDYTRDLISTQNNFSPAVTKAITYILTNYNRNIQISVVSEQIHISESRLMHIFREETGKSFQQFLTEYRIYLAKLLLETGRYKLYEISDAIGYQNPLSFRRAFAKIEGVNPSQYSCGQGKGAMNETP